MRERIKSVKCQNYNRNNNYNYNHNREEATTRNKAYVKPDQPKYYIRIGTGRFYVAKHEIEGYEKIGVKIHKE